MGFLRTPVSIGARPFEDISVMLSDTLALTANTQNDWNILDAIASEAIDCVQMIFVDNRLGASPVEVWASTTNLRLYIPAGRQAYLPFPISHGDARISFLSAGAVASMPIAVFNTLFPALVW